MELFTQRLVLRPWRESDAEALYALAKDPRLGPIAGWPPHQSVAESRVVIRDVFSAPETYAVCRRNDGTLLGCVGFLFGEAANIPLQSDEAELGYWLGHPFWGQGLIPEACQALIRYAFDTLHLKSLWATARADNHNSRRVLEKCGFTYQRTDAAQPDSLTGDTVAQTVYRRTRE